MVTGVFAAAAFLLSQASPQPVDANAGWDSFEQYCAPCHGTSARGDGPVAPALKRRPSDLTRLASRNRGTYPHDRVRALLLGAAQVSPAHGSRQMPVWGPVFRRFEFAERTEARVENLVAYIASLQERDR